MVLGTKNGHILTFSLETPLKPRLTHVWKLGDIKRSVNLSKFENYRVLVGSPKEGVIQILDVVTGRETSKYINTNENVASHFTIL